MAPPLGGAGRWAAKPENLATLEGFEPSIFTLKG